jgi:O-antigen/teichoic acid export membrane protein
MTGVLLARFLGADDYGTLVFLIATSISLKQLLDLGSSSAFFTFLSQETRSIKFIFQFLTFFFVKYFLLSLAILFIMPTVWLSKVWLGNSALIIVVALIAISMQNDFWQIASQLLESQRKTTKAQLFFVTFQLIHFFCIFILFYEKQLTVFNYLILIGLLWLVAGVIAIVNYKPIQHSYASLSKAPGISDYINYCLPIAPVILITFIGEFLDRWMLQNWAGSRQQAYFSVSAQIASISLLMTASFIKIFWKEVAEEFHNGNIQEALELYLMARKIIFFGGVFIAAIFIPWTSEILVFLFGDTYLLAGTALIFLMIYSIHQSIGQIDSAFLMASGKTNIGFGVNMWLIPIGLFISYIFISKFNFQLGGFDLGAAGLAMKMVIIQLMTVNIIGINIQKKFNIKFSYLDQLQIFAVFIFLGITIKGVLIFIIPPFDYIFLFGIFLHSSCCILIAIVFPRLITLPIDWMKMIKPHFSHKISI